MEGGSVTLVQQVRARLDKWKEIGASDTVLSMLQGGVDVFKGGDRQGLESLYGHFEGVSVITGDEGRWLEAELLAKAKAGAYTLRPLSDLRPGQLESYCVTRAFVIPKPNRPYGNWRLINDLRVPNTFLPYRKFRYEGLPALAEFLREGWWFASLDLLDAYQHVGLTEKTARLCCFVFNGWLVIARVLPFGIGWAPWAFTKIMRVPLRHWRAQGIFVILYLDDLIVAAPTKEELLAKMEVIRRTLEELGIAVNWRKSHWEPVQRGTWLGMGIDTVKHEFFIPEEKLAQLKELLDTFIERSAKGPVPAREAAKLAGKISCWRLALAPVELVTRELFNCLSSAAGDYSSVIVVSEGAREDLLFLRRNLDSWNGKAIWRPSLLATVRIESDASDRFWACIVKGGTAPLSELLELRGPLSEDEAGESSTYRELLAVLSGLRLLQERLRHQRVLLLSDSQSGVACLQRSSARSPACWSVVREIGKLALELDCLLSPVWVPRERNRHADWATREEADPGDWWLDPAAVRAARARWPELSEEDTVDRFADHAHHAFPRFNSRWFSPAAEAIDCYAQDWSTAMNWLVPPLSQLGRALQHLRECGGDAVLVHPVWPSATWWPLLLEMRVGPSLPLQLEWVRNGASGLAEPRRNAHWTLAVTRVAAVSAAA